MRRIMSWCSRQLAYTSEGGGRPGSTCCCHSRLITAFGARGGTEQPRAQPGGWAASDSLHQHAAADECLLHVVGRHPLTQQHEPEQLIVALHPKHPRALGGRPAHQQTAGRACSRVVGGRVPVSPHQQLAKHQTCRQPPISTASWQQQRGQCCDSPAQSMCSCSCGTHSGSTACRGPRSATASSEVRSRPPLQQDQRGRAQAIQLQRDDACIHACTAMPLGATMVMKSRHA